MKKQDLINEVMGVPKVMDFWVNGITEFIIKHIEYSINNEKKYWKTTSTYIGNDEVVTNITMDIIGGDELMTYLSNSEKYTNLYQNNSFRDFPLYEPKLSLILYTIPDDQYNKVVKSSVSASYVSSDLKLVKSGKLKVIKGVTFRFKIPILESNYNSGVLDINKLKSIIKPSIAHELHHSYQEYKEMLKGRDLFKQSQELTLNRTSGELSNIVESEKWEEFLYLVYLHLSFELNARIPQLKYTLENENIKTPDDFFKILKNTEGWGEYEYLKGFNSNTFYKNLKDDIINNEPDITDDNVDQFISSLVTEWDNIIKKIIRDNKSINIDTDHIKPISKNMIENPKLFFDFFEKRFHRKSEDYRRKILKLINLYI